MTKKDWYRALMHFPVGAIAGGVSFFYPAVGIALFAGELAYEVINDWRKKDSSYKDVLGIVWGYGLVAVAVTVIRLL